MRIQVYDKCWEGIFQLPKHIQTKVIDFIKKFRENSKSSAIHLEPISTFKDSSLRSARIDQTYRAILKAVVEGSYYSLVWVDHHDKAYAWAKNKKIEWNDQIQSIQVFTAPEEIPHIESSPQYIENKVEGLFSEYSDEQLGRIGVPSILLPSVRRILNLDDLEQIMEYIPPDVFENLFYLADGANIALLIHEIEEGMEKSEELETQLVSINNQRSFIEITDDTMLNEAVNGNFQRWKYFLHPSQRKLVNSSFNGSCKVSGGAGTGKTVAALHRAKYLMERRKPGEKILFTTFTKALTENLGELLEGMELKNESFHLINIDALAMQGIRTNELLPKDFKVFEYQAIKRPIELLEEIVAKEKTLVHATFLEEEYREVVLKQAIHTLDAYLRAPRRGRGKPLSRLQRKEIWELLQLFEEKKRRLNVFYKDEIFNVWLKYLQDLETKPYTNILVDELQDFSDVELRCIRALVPEGPNDLFMVGDPMQRIYPRTLSFKNVGINIQGKRSRRLRINYRTTEEIKKLALSVIKDCHYDNFEGEEEERAGYVSLFHGDTPTYQTFKTKDEEVQSVGMKIKELLSAGFTPASVAICSRTKEGLRDFESLLYKEEIPYMHVAKKSGSVEGISLLTFHGVKGLEFKHVFLVDVNERTCPLKPYDFSMWEEEEQRSYLQMERSLLYVAITRAVGNVFISGVGNKTPLIK